jgi:hypothetical protein
VVYEDNYHIVSVLAFQIFLEVYQYMLPESVQYWQEVEQPGLLVSGHIYVPTGITIVAIPIYVPLLVWPIVPALN